jgi:hypothetical protein
MHIRELSQVSNQLREPDLDVLIFNRRHVDMSMMLSNKTNRQTG